MVLYVDYLNEFIVWDEKLWKRVGVVVQPGHLQVSFRLVPNFREKGGWVVSGDVKQLPRRSIQVNVVLPDKEIVSPCLYPTYVGLKVLYFVIFVR